MKKFLILALLFIIPSALYLLLQTGENKYEKMEIFGPKEPVKKIINGKEVIDTVYHTAGDFSLYDTDSNLVTGKITDGKIYVVDFFFSTCKTICPKMSNQLMRVQHNFKKDDEVVILSFTVDPGNDTPARLKEYAAKHNAIPGKWYFLTGDKEQIYSLARNSYFLNALEGSGGEDAFLHSEQFLLMDKEKRIRGIYDGTNHFEVKKLMEDIAALKNEYANPSR
ncbi:MAG: SCO family protein [Bacteroidetes bacterium]|nr:SCO family protein [Bacteroidota bacterium]